MSCLWHNIKAIVDCCVGKEQIPAAGRLLNGAKRSLNGAKRSFLNL